MLKIKTSVFSDIGQERNKNQDNLFWCGHYRSQNEVDFRFEDIATVDNPVQIYAISDGIGGMASGEIAARIAVSDLEALAYAIDLSNVDEDVNLISDYLREKAIYMSKKNSLQDNPDMHMGATLSILVFRDDRAYLANIGDTAVYSLSSNGLKRISRNDSHAAKLRELGHISYEEESKHPLKHALSNYLGMEYQKDKFSYYILKDIPLHNGDMFLLCSDGLSSFVEEDSIHKILSSSLRLHDKTRKLVDLALEKGSHDNISIILLEILECDACFQEPIIIKDDNQLNKAKPNNYPKQSLNKDIMHDETTVFRPVKANIPNTQNINRVDKTAESNSIFADKQAAYYEKARKDSLRRQEKQLRKDRRTSDKTQNDQVDIDPISSEEKQKYYDARYLNMDEIVEGEKPRQIKRKNSWLSWLLHILLFIVIGFLVAWLVFDLL